MSNTKYVIDVQNNIAMEIEMTEEELLLEAETQALMEQNRLAQEAAEAEAKAAAEAKLAALGLTAEEIAALSK